MLWRIRLGLEDLEERGGEYYPQSTSGKWQGKGFSFLNDKNKQSHYEGVEKFMVQITQQKK